MQLEFFCQSRGTIIDSHDLNRYKDRYIKRNIYVNGSYKYSPKIIFM